MSDRDIVDVLLEDHHEFRELLDELQSIDPEQRQDLFHYTVARLASHEAAEEAIVHPALRADVPGGEAIAEDVLEQEASAEQLLADMSDMDPTSDEFESSLEDLAVNVLAHAEHEEREEFPRLREHLDADRRREMAELFQKVRDAGPTRPHPRTPQSPVVRAVTGPIVGAFDRARDTARDALGR